MGMQDPAPLKAELIDAARNWLTMDGLWFLAVEAGYGLAAAMEIDRKVWQDFSRIEAGRIKKRRCLPDNGGLEALETALRHRLHSLLHDFRIERAGNDTLCYYMVECRTQAARERKGLPLFPCREIGIVEYSVFAKTIDPRISTECIACPPDRIKRDFCCGWRFRLLSSFPSKGEGINSQALKKNQTETMYELVSPVNFRTVLKYLGILLIGMGLVTIVPFTVILSYSQHTAAVLYGLAGGIVIGLGYVLYRFLPDEELQWKEAMVITALVFPVAAFISAIPFTIFEGLSLVDAYFEAVSGVTTTGLSVAPGTVGPLFLFARSWLQWIGGIGILIIVLSLIAPGGISASRLFGAGIGDRKIRPNVLGTAIVLFEVYLVITFISFTLLFFSGMSPFDALCQALSSVSTGGFSTRPNSVAGFGGWAIPVVIIISCVLGSVNFEVFTRMARNPFSLFRSAQFRWFLSIGLLGSGLLAFTLIDAGGNPSVVIPGAVFQGFSSLTTAGFSTMDISTFPDSSKAVMSVLMWIGGSMGSTAGGIKVLRIIALFSIIRLVFIRFFVPRETVTTLKIGNTPVTEDQVYHLATFLFLYFLVLVVSALFFMLSGYPMADSVFETSSALGTVGLSTGITGAALALPLKAVLIIDMLLGRIEIIPLILLIFPRTWVRRAG